MKYSELKRSLANGIEPVYILTGSDDFLRNYAVSLIKDRCVSMPDLNFASVDGENMSIAAESVYTSLVSFPFMSDKRMVVLKEYYPTADELKKNGLAEYLKNPLETSVLAFNNRKDCRALEKAGAVTVDCNPDMALCVGWICNEAKKNSLSVSPAVAGKIAEYSLLDFTKINSELGKLIDYCAESGTIDMKAVDEVVHKDSEYQVYEMVERISSGNFDDAYSILTDLLSKNESEQRLFISIYSHFRRMLHVAVSDAKNSELAEVLGVKEYAVKMTRMQTRKFPVKRIKSICEKFSFYDAAFKRGDTGLSSVLWNGVFSAMIN
ncbi:MAG: DNA polymerase III subunit delta [Clostridia bacterium]|nr:DNA polymerase III subunit delta [Clostridia bacterium]